MFEQGYKFELVTKHRPAQATNFICEHLYRFATDSGHTYLVRIHECINNVFAIKFHLKRDSDNKNKYNLIVNERFTSVHASRVLKTVINISIKILESNKLASFAFVGVFKIKQNEAGNRNSNETKETEKTQRWRTYKRIVEYFFGSQTFKHIYQEKSNAYLLINKNNQHFDELTDQVITMFINTFHDLGDLQ